MSNKIPIMKISYKVYRISADGLLKPYDGGKCGRYSTFSTPEEALAHVAPWAEVTILPITETFIDYDD